MSNLATTYRPTRLKQIIGQKGAVDTVRGLLARDKIPAGLLVHGPHGTGKTSLARVLARYLNCTDRADGGEPCGKCSSCKMMRRPDSHPDYVEIDAGSDRGINMVRELAQLVKHYPRSKYRIVVLDECQSMTRPSFDALLKTLEEPPSDTIFILVTTAPDRIPRTIQSRCVNVPLKPAPSVVVAKRLVYIAKREQFTLSTKVAEAIADATYGHIRDAVMALEALLNIAAAAEVTSVDDLDKNALNKALSHVTHSSSALAATFVRDLMSQKLYLAYKILDQVSDMDGFLSDTIRVLRCVIRHCIAGSKLVEYRFRAASAAIADESGMDNGALHEQATRMLGSTLEVQRFVRTSTGSVIDYLDYLASRLIVDAVLLTDEEEPEEEEDE